MIFSSSLCCSSTSLILSASSLSLFTFFLGLSFSPTLFLLSSFLSSSRFLTSWAILSLSCVTSLSDLSVSSCPAKAAPPGRSTFTALLVAAESPKSLDRKPSGRVGSCSSAGLRSTNCGGQWQRGATYRSSWWWMARWQMRAVRQPSGLAPTTFFCGLHWSHSVSLLASTGTRSAQNSR